MAYEILHEQHMALPQNSRYRYWITGLATVMLGWIQLIDGIGAERTNLQAAKQPPVNETNIASPQSKPLSDRSPTVRPSSVTGAIAFCGRLPVTFKDETVGLNMAQLKDWCAGYIKFVSEQEAVEAFGMYHCGCNYLKQDMK